MNQNKKVELLAPAGNKEAFYGAIHAGADAIYLGGSRFGARAYADNFTEEELISCIRYAHIWGRKVYLTVNTLVKETELAELYQYLHPYYKAGLDGVIVQDIGVFAYIRENFPSIELHVSTQMTLTGEYGASLLKDMGACRIVPARELSLDEIISMKQETGLEIETFIHGAMCYCYSGQCLFSSVLGGRSGNRGRCAQPCRLPYSVKNKKDVTKECYPLSLKDMCTIEHIPALIEAGIDSFKIEGRMKKPEYAAGVTAIYRKYIDLYYANPNREFKVSKKDLEKLSRLYIRSERQTGYYYKHNGKEMITLESPAYSGSDEALLSEIRMNYLDKTPQIPVTAYGYFQTGEEALVTFIADDISVTVTGDIVQEASKQPISKENVEKQLKKLGDTSFILETLDVTISEQAFYPLKAINELRREAAVRLEDALIDRNGLPRERKDAVTELKAEAFMPRTANNFLELNKDIEASTSSGNLHLSVKTMEQLDAVVDYIHFNAVARLYVDADLFLANTEGVMCKLKGISCEVILAMPYIIRKSDNAYLEKLLSVIMDERFKIAGLLVRSLEGMGFLLSHKYSGSIYADTGFYLWNHRSILEWQPVINGFCLPLELKGVEQRALTDTNLPCEKIFYGRIPMMITANCVAKTTSGCRKGSSLKTGENTLELIDRYHKKLPVVLNCTHCMNIIYNTVPLSLHSEWNKWKTLTNMRLDFTTENAQETTAVLEYFNAIHKIDNASKMKQPPYAEYTTGHEKRGVE